jgi:hypothetical protein
VLSFNVFQLINFVSKSIVFGTPKLVRLFWDTFLGLNRLKNPKKVYQI